MTHALLFVPTILPAFFAKNLPGEEKKKKDEYLNTYEDFSKVHMITVINNTII